MMFDFGIILVLKDRSGFFDPSAPLVRLRLTEVDGKYIGGNLYLYSPSRICCGACHYVAP